MSLTGWCPGCQQVRPNFKQTDEKGVTICCSQCSRILRWVPPPCEPAEFEVDGVRYVEASTDDVLRATATSPGILRWFGEVLCVRKG